MRVSIRYKFVLILVVAAAMPLMLGIATLRQLGFHYLMRQKGELYETRARHMAGHLTGVLTGQFQTLQHWVAYGDFSAALEDRMRGGGGTVPGELVEDIEDIEARWVRLTIQDPLLRDLLGNPLSQRLNDFSAGEPLYTEIFVTDAEGRLVAATNKTTDYWQADEQWWRKAFALPRGRSWIEGVHFDESAAVYSIDIAMPLWPPHPPPSPGGEAEPPPALAPIGVIKAVLDVSPLLRRMPPLLREDAMRAHVVSSEGLLLVGLFGEEVEPMAESIDANLLSAFVTNSSGWLVTPVLGDNDEMTGFASVDPAGPGGLAAGLTGGAPLKVLVHADYATIMAPVNAQLQVLTVVGSMIVLLFLMVGLYIAHRKIMEPLRALRRASQAMEARVGVREAGTLKLNRETIKEAARDAEARLDEVGGIEPGDEIGDLARGFAAMARRVLNYHSQLEAELDRRTEEIEADLKMAHDFQLAMLPASYPEVPEQGENDPLRLKFYHIYRPTLSVGGDFFQIEKLDAHRAGVILVDVMGHGARAALVTAMIRTLFQNLCRREESPAAALTMINRQFMRLVSQTHQVVFATAFYGIVDTQEGKMRYCSAGHLPPLIGNREEGTAMELAGCAKVNPAIGLVEDQAFEERTYRLKPGDTVLILTDGVLEAPNPRGEEFGLERIVEIFEEHKQKGGSGICGALMTALHAHMDTVVSPDDICMVSIDAEAR